MVKRTRLKYTDTDIDTHRYHEIDKNKLISRKRRLKGYIIAYRLAICHSISIIEIFQKQHEHRHKNRDKIEVDVDDDAFYHTLITNTNCIS